MISYKLFDQPASQQSVSPRTSYSKLDMEREGKKERTKCEDEIAWEPFCFFFST